MALAVCPQRVRRGPRLKAELVALLAAEGTLLLEVTAAAAVMLLPLHCETALRAANVFARPRKRVMRRARLEIDD